jgi:hypothetical protein
MIATKVSKNGFSRIVVQITIFLNKLNFYNMKNFFIGMGFFAVVTIMIFNINTALNVSSSVIDITLQTEEAAADSESGSSHGRPLLQNVSTGAYKCANCSGTDCGAVC